MKGHYINNFDIEPSASVYTGTRYDKNVFDEMINI